MLLFGCASSHSPESVAEKALDIIGNGKYMSASQLQEDSDIFTMCYVDSDFGESFLYGDEIK